MTVSISMNVSFVVTELVNLQLQQQNLAAKTLRTHEISVCAGELFSLFVCMYSMDAT